MKHILCGIFFVCFLSAGAQPLLIHNGDRIAFLGDSITNFGNRPDGYIGLVMDGLKRSGVKAEAIPAGVSGDTSREMLRRLPDVLQKKPTWLFFSCGVNDVGHGDSGVSLPDYRKNVTAILDLCKKSGVKVMILMPTLCSETLNDPLNEVLQGYCRFLKDEAAKRSLPVADLNTTMRTVVQERNEKGLSPVTIDNLHMNGVGNQMMAHGILLAIGVQEKELALWKKEWDKIPSMAPILNLWYQPEYKLSINEYDALYAEARKRNTSVETLVWQVIMDYVKKTSVTERIAVFSSFSCFTAKNLQV